MFPIVLVASILDKWQLIFVIAKLQKNTVKLSTKQSNLINI